MFLFDVDPLDHATVLSISLNASELSAYRFVSVDEARKLLHFRVARRLDEVLRPTSRCVYLEDQRPPV